MSRPVALTLTIIITVVLLAGTVAIGWYLRERQVIFYTDADTIRQPHAQIDPRDVLWQPPTLVEGLLKTELDEYEPRLTYDGTTMFFVRGKAGENADLWVASLTPDGWSDPQSLDALNT